MFYSKFAKKYYCTIECGVMYFFLFQINPSAYYGDTWQADIPNTECVETCSENDITCPDDSQAVADCTVIKNVTGIFKVRITIQMSNSPRKFNIKR